jgi:hypothetical protein
MINWREKKRRSHQSTCNPNERERSRDDYREQNEQHLVESRSENAPDMDLDTSQIRRKGKKKRTPYTRPRNTSVRTQTYAQAKKKKSKRTHAT